MSNKLKKLAREAREKADTLRLGVHLSRVDDVPLRRRPRMEAGICGR
jgi:hypothetical protein